MFVAITTYLRPFSLDEPVVRQHWAYQDQAYADDRFVCSGPQEPPTGGVLVVRGTDAEEVSRYLDDDPFVREGIVRYVLIRFRPTRGAHADLVEPVPERHP